jgi:hypothetical protein
MRYMVGFITLAGEYKTVDFGDDYDGAVRFMRAAETFGRPAELKEVG